MSRMSRLRKRKLVEGVIYLSVMVVAYLCFTLFIAYVGKSTMLTVLRTPFFTFCRWIMISIIVAFAYNYAKKYIRK